MDLDRLRSFLAVVDTGSLNKAAETLGVSRATLRKRLSDLEARVGTALFQSTRAGKLLTPAGASLAEAAPRLYAEAIKVLKSAQQLGSEPHGVLRLGLHHGLPPQVMTPVAEGL